MRRRGLVLAMLEQIDLYLRSLLAVEGASPATAQTYRPVLISLAAACGGKDPASVTKADVMRWAVSLGGQARSTRARKFATVRSFFRWLRHNDLVNGDPTENLTTPRRRRALPKYLTGPEVESILAAAHADMRTHALVGVLYSAGLRVSECVGLNRDSVDFGRLELRVLGKGGKERVVPFAPEVAAALRAYLEERSDSGQPLFVNRYADRLSQRSVQKEVHELAERAGIQKHVTPHVLRHSIASHMLQSGKVNLMAVRDFLGHADVATTQIYAHLSDETRRAQYTEFYEQGDLFDKAGPDPEHGGEHR